MMNHQPTLAANHTATPPPAPEQRAAEALATASSFDRAQLAWLMAQAYRWGYEARVDEENDTRPWGLLEDDVTKSEFLSWMTEWARSSAGRAAIATALLTYDPGRGPDGRPAFPGIPDPWTPGDTVSPSTAIATILSTVRDSRRVLDQERAEVPPSAAEIAEAVVARLAGTGTAAEKAATLRAVLGPDAAEVGRILAAGLPAA